MRKQLLISFLLLSLGAWNTQAQKLATTILNPFEDNISLKVPDGEDWLFTKGGSSTRYKEFKILNSETPGQVQDARITGRLYYPESKEDMKNITLKYLSKISYKEPLSKETMRMDKGELANGERVSVFTINTNPFERRGEQVEVRAKVYMFARQVDGKAYLYFITARETSREKYHFSSRYFPQLEEMLETIDF